MLGRAATKLFTRINAGRAVNMVSGAMHKGGATYGIFRGAGAGRAMSAGYASKEFGSSAYKGLRNWAWTSPRSNLTRGLRVGALGATGLTAANFVRPKNNWGPF